MVSGAGLMMAPDRDPDGPVAAPVPGPGPSPAPEHDPCCCSDRFDDISPTATRGSSEVRARRSSRFLAVHLVPARRLAFILPGHASSDFRRLPGSTRACHVRLSDATSPAGLPRLPFCRWILVSRLGGGRVFLSLFVLFCGFWFFRFFYLGQKRNTVTT